MKERKKENLESVEHSWVLTKGFQERHVTGASVSNKREDQFWRVPHSFVVTSLISFSSSLFLAILQSCFLVFFRLWIINDSQNKYFYIFVRQKKMKWKTFLTTKRLNFSHLKNLNFLWISTDSKQFICCIKRNSSHNIISFFFCSPPK